MERFGIDYDYEYEYEHDHDEDEEEKGARRPSLFGGDYDLPSRNRTQGQDALATYSRHRGLGGQPGSMAMTKPKPIPIPIPIPIPGHPCHSLVSLSLSLSISGSCSTCSTHPGIGHKGKMPLLPTQTSRAGRSTRFDGDDETDTDTDTGSSLPLLGIYILILIDIGILLDLFNPSRSRTQGQDALATYPDIAVWAVNLVRGSLN
jgi:hypothetical protein